MRGVVAIKDALLRHKKLAALIGVIIVLLIAAGVAVTIWHAHQTKSTVAKNPVATQYKKELPSLEKAVKANPKSSDAHKNYAVALYATGDLKKALSEYQQVVKLNDKDAVAYNNLGNVYRDLGKYQDATDAYNKAISLDSSNMNTYANLANVQLYMENDTNGAIATYKKGLKALPKNAQLEFLLGLAYEKKGDTTNARATYQHILSYDASNQSAQAELTALQNNK